MTKLQPLGTKLVVRKDRPATKTAAGIIIPQKTLDKEAPRKGTVVAIGPEVGFKSFEARRKLIEVLRQDIKSEVFPAGTVEGSIAPIWTPRIGDTVLFNAFAGTDIEVGEGNEMELLTVMLEDDVLAIVSDDGKTASDEFATAAKAVTGTSKKQK